MTTTDPRVAPGSHRPDWLPAHQPSHQRAHQPSHQAPPQPPEPTHRIVTPAPHQQSPQPSHQASHQASHQPSHHLSHQPDHTTPESEWDDEPLGFRDRIADAFAGLRFVSDSPGSLRDQLDYAREGAYTIRSGGLWRKVNIGYARFIAAPGLAICYFICWAFFTRLSRAITVLVIAVPLLAVLNGVPVVELVIPDWADVTSWF